MMLQCETGGPRRRAGNHLLGRVHRKGEHVKTKLLLILAALLVLATPMFAQGGAAAEKGAGNSYWIWIASGFSMAFASGLCGLAQSKVVAAACEGMGRNPGAADAIRFALIFGLAFIESLALFTLVIIIMKVA